MRIYESCANSVDICIDANADYMFSYAQGGIGVTLVKNEEWIGYLDCHTEYLGDDFLISKVVVYRNEELSKRLTEKYKGKILIASIHKDRVN